jgi:hypothetical protein
MPEVGLVFLKPFVDRTEVHDEVVAQRLIRRPESRRSPLGAADMQVEHCSIGRMHSKRNTGVIHRATP